MKEIVTHYTINDRTMAIVAVAHMEYNCLVLEHDRQVFVKHTPIILIKLACLENGSTYEGRRTAVMFKTACKQKVPIPISPCKNIYTFPTHSPGKFQCAWIIYNHVLLIRPITPWKNQQSNLQSSLKTDNN